MCKCPSTQLGAISGIAGLRIGLTSIFPVSLVMYWYYLINMAGGARYPCRELLGVKHK